MAQTLSVTHNEVRNVAVVSFLDTGTVAATAFTVGFRPRIVRVVNETSRDMMEWFEGMTNAHGVKTVAAGTRTKVTSNGITVSATGFTVGLDTDVLVTNEQLRIEVIG
jgi:hypothetical protein